MNCTGRNCPFQGDIVDTTACKAENCPYKTEPDPMDRAIQILRDLFEYACQQEWIRKPLAWALYQTWKVVDNERE